MRKPDTSDAASQRTQEVPAALLQRLLLESGRKPLPTLLDLPEARRQLATD